MIQKNQLNSSDENIVTVMVNKINKFSSGLQEYQIRELVEDTEKLGNRLAINEKLKTNQIRKFLDAVNRLKTILANNNNNFASIEPELVFLQVKLVYAAARQRQGKNMGPVEPLKLVLEAAIKQVNSTPGFERFVQLNEAIIAYHKAAGGKDQ